MDVEEISSKMPGKTSADLDDMQEFIFDSRRGVLWHLLDDGTYAVDDGSSRTVTTVADERRAVADV